MRFHHVISDREYVGRTVDVSDGGLRMYVPAVAPLRTGQSIRLPLGEVGLPKLAPQGDRTLDARIVRVDRDGLAETGQVLVGVEFRRPFQFLAG
jgi:c-di-GMP-binding flagellar brake protein YcgR